MIRYWKTQNKVDEIARAYVRNETSTLKAWIALQPEARAQFKDDEDFRREILKSVRRQGL